MVLANNSGMLRCTEELSQLLIVKVLINYGWVQFRFKQGEKYVISTRRRGMSSRGLQLRETAALSDPVRLLAALPWQSYSFTDASSVYGALGYFRILCPPDRMRYTHCIRYSSVVLDWTPLLNSICSVCVVICSLHVMQTCCTT